jgi:hypothetical protein
MFLYGDDSRRSMTASLKRLFGFGMFWLGVFVGQGFATGADIVKPALFDLDAIYDPRTLEIEVHQDWKEAPKSNDVLLKLVEITVCEWWRGQKVRLPVTFAVPKGQTPCRHVVVENMGLALKAAMPSEGSLELLQKHGVGVVMVGMGTLDAMEPKGKLHLGMREQLLKTKDARYTPAWIWGMSDMRAMTAASVESSMFQPEKVLATGGSKRGVGAAVSGIHDPRFTAIMPVVAPIHASPGGLFVRGSGLPEVDKANQNFLDALAPGPNPLHLPETARQAFLEREQRRLDQAITVEQALEAGWSHDEMVSMNKAAWHHCLIANHLEKVEQRKLAYFFHIGTNDNVCPDLIELGKAHADFPIYILPGGQHGGPKTNGYSLQTPSRPEVEQNLVAFGQHHFFGGDALPKPPVVSIEPASDGRQLKVEVGMNGESATTMNKLSWCLDRSPAYTFAAEFDVWETAELMPSESGNLHATIDIPLGAHHVDFVSTHTTQLNGSPFHFSSAYTRWMQTPSKR